LLAALLTVSTAGWTQNQAAAETASTTPSTAEDYELVSWRDRYLELGRDVYQWACAACHAEGLDGAPRTGDRAAWSDRSELWSAVLLEHAKQGYLEMPAKGGHPYLSERAVQAAAEYMLGETFPEKLRD
jgi:cytochrome c5